MAAEIHESVVIDPRATIGPGASIGPYTVIEGPVTIGTDARIGPRVHICGHTTIGDRVRIHAGAIIGDTPQDHSFSTDTVSYTTIGDDCTFREYVQIHRGNKDGSSTTIGNKCMFMVFAHVAHDCHIADRVCIVNNVSLGGHIAVEQGAFISAGSLGHQFIRVGEYAMVSAYIRMQKDVPPYCMIGAGNRIYGPNVVGLRRAGKSGDTRKAIRAAIKTLFFSKLSTADGVAKILADHPEVPEIAHLAEFMQSSKRGTLTSEPIQIHD